LLHLFSEREAQAREEDILHQTPALLSAEIGLDVHLLTVWRHLDDDLELLVIVSVYLL